MTDAKTAKVEPTIRADLTLTKDDIINIRISEIEEAALAEIAAKTEANSKIQERINELRKKATDIISVYVKNTFGDFGADLEAALSKYFTKVSRQLSFNEARERDEEESKTKINVGVRIYMSNQRGQEDVNLYTDGVIPQDALDLRAQATALEKEIAENNDLIFTEKRKIAQLAVTERRARAALSRAMLGGQGGQAILAALGSVGANIPLLGTK